MYDVNRLRFLIDEAQRSITDIHTEIGKAYALSHKEDQESPFRAQILRLADLEDRIESLQNQLMAAQGIVLCPSCGAQVSAFSAFCNSCGAQIIKQRQSFCTYCGAPMSEGSQFCTTCGTGVNGERNNPVPPAPGYPQYNANPMYAPEPPRFAPQSVQPQYAPEPPRFAPQAAQPQYAPQAQPQYAPEQPHFAPVQQPQAPQPQAPAAVPVQNDNNATVEIVRRCKHCAAEISHTALFCTKCGTKQE